MNSGLSHASLSGMGILILKMKILKERYKPNKEDKAFLLVELRIAIQRESYYCFHVTMCYNPC
jgi:Ni/Fe-hydrogenase subunit HybB-like protein